MKTRMKIALAGYGLIAASLLLINLLTSATYLWSLIPNTLLLWWPLGVYYSLKKNPVTLSILGTVLNMSFFVGLNLALTPAYPWVVFIIGPMLFWPIGVILGKKASTASFAWLSYLFLLIYYVLINVFIEPRHGFSVYIAYALVWWPMARAKKVEMNPKVFSLVGVLFHIAFMVGMNYFVKPEYFWSIYLIGPLMMWPIAVFLGNKAKSLSFAWMSFLGLGIYYTLINLVYEPRHPFILYILFALIWWPLGLAFKNHQQAFKFSVQGFLVFVILFMGINWITTPNLLWGLYPLSVLTVWPILAFILEKKARQV